MPQSTQQLIPSLLGNHLSFVAPDSGLEKTPYACSFH